MIRCWLWLESVLLPCLLSTHRLLSSAGIAVSNDPVLQTRVLAYADTQRYRLGVNYQLLPVSFAPGSYEPFLWHFCVAVLATSVRMLAKRRMQCCLRCSKLLHLNI